MADEIVGLPKLKVDDLKKELLKRGLPTKGSKAELQQRLLDSLKSDVADKNEEKNNDDEENDEVPDLGNSTEDEGEEVVTNEEFETSLDVKVSDVEVKEVDPDLKQTINVEKSEEKPEIATVKIGTATNETEKRLLRGKRFGEITNETDKKKLRSERFNSGGTDLEVVIKGKTISGDEVNRLKKRAERFGVISPVIDKLEEGDKKLKRQQRFGVVTSVSTAPSANSLDARKKKRADRFGMQ